MNWAAYLDQSELPPRPDPKTGLPRPPHAPAFSHVTKPKDSDPGRDRDPAIAPMPPPGQGPVLAWFKSNSRSALLTAAWSLPIFVLGITLLQGFSARWMAYWSPWLVVVLGITGVYFSRRGTQCAAGADWLRRRKSWVRTYEIVKVTAHAYSNAVQLHLTDQDGRKVEISGSDLQENRDIWDLVYNGILHSVIASQAQTNGLLHQALNVPYPKSDEGA